MRASSSSFIYFGLTFALVLSLSVIYGQFYAHRYDTGITQTPYGDPNSIKTAINLFVMVMVATTVYLVFARKSKNKILFIILGSVLVSSQCLLLWQYFSPTLAIILAILAIFAVLGVARVHTSNIVFLFVLGLGAGAIGVSMSPSIVFLFFLAMAIYDFIAVFITKHMLTLVGADKATDTIPEVVAGAVKIPGLGFIGGGDFLLPAMYAVSFIRVVGPLGVLMIGAIGSTGVLYLLAHREIGTPLPALPPLFISSAIGSFLIGVAVWI